MKRSIKMSEGRSSSGPVFFLIREAFRLAIVDLRLAVVARVRVEWASVITDRGGRTRELSTCLGGSAYAWVAASVYEHELEQDDDPMRMHASVVELH